jgi:hypothetical protein
MRNTKHFTPDLLDRFRELGRGLGTYESHVPWHRVSRIDPSSYGRSHLMKFQGRQKELLSDDEWVASLFTTMVPNADDLREQFPLALTAACHELGAYDVRLGVPNQPGTIDIARQLGIKHPRVNGNGRSAPWVLSTDLLIALLDANGGRRLLAVSCKCGDPLADRRTKELLSIERQYWTVRGVEWLLVTPDLYDESVELTLRNSMPWALGEQVPDAAKKAAISVAHQLDGLPLFSTLERLESTLGGDLDLAQRAFWQAVWSRDLPLDLRRGWRPHLPTTFLNSSGFLSLNPIASRRSAWN